MHRRRYSAVAPCPLLPVGTDPFLPDPFHHRLNQISSLLASCNVSCCNFSACACAGGPFTGFSPLNPALTFAGSLVFDCVWRYMWMYLLGQATGAALHWLNMHGTKFLLETNCQQCRGTSVLLHLCLFAHKRHPQPVTHYASDAETLQFIQLTCASFGNHLAWVAVGLSAGSAICCRCRPGCAAGSWRLRHRPHVPLRGRTRQLHCPAWWTRDWAVWRRDWHAVWAAAGWCPGRCTGHCRWHGRHFLRLSGRGLIV
jgi:hypothetical protein